MENSKILNPKLLRCEDGSPFSFCIRHCDDKPRLVAMIEAAGGRVVENSSDPFTINLGPPSPKFNCHGFDTFGYDFVFECLQSHKVLNLNLFRIGSQSQTYQSYCANDILFKRLSWNDVPLLEASEVQMSLDGNLLDDKQIESLKGACVNGSFDSTTGMAGSDLPVSSGSSTCSELELPPSSQVTKDLHSEINEDFIVSNSNSTVRSVFGENSGLRMSLPKYPESSTNSPPRRRRKKTYSQEQQQQIIDYIICQNGYNNLKGVNFWKKFEAANIVKDRTWQSLKEQFLKNIYPRIHFYKVDSEVFQKIRKGMTL